MPALVMGVLNVTPDSFSDGGRWLDADAAVGHGRTLLAAGAAVLDVGAESTRPGAEPVDATTQIARLVPVIERLAPDAAAAGARISVDTRDAAVAEAAVAAGAELVNDVSSSLHETCAGLDVGWIAMHMRGDPRTMQDDPRYDDVVSEVLDHLLACADAARAAGVHEVWIDPGIGFGKAAAHNWALLAGIDRFVATGLPVVVGSSRKGFLGAAIGRSDGTDAPAPVDDRLQGSLATAVWAATMGVRMIRCHDARATVHAVTVVGEPAPERLTLLEVV